MTRTLIGVYEERKNMGMQADWQSTTATRAFYVLYDEVDTGQQMAAWEAVKDYLVAEDGGANLLKWGDGVPHFPGYSRLPLNSIEISQEGQEPKWLVTVTYKSADISHMQGNHWQGMVGSFPPWWLPWNIATSFSPISYTPVMGGILSIERWENIGKKEQELAYLYQADPRVFMTRSSRLNPQLNNGITDDNGFGWQEQYLNYITNSAGERFDNPPEEELFLMTLSLSGARNPAAFPLDGATLMPYIGCINADPIVIAGNWFDWGYLRIKNASITTNTWEGQIYQDMSIEIEANPLSWKHTVLDRGFTSRTPKAEFIGKIPAVWGPPARVLDTDGELIEWDQVNPKTSDDETRSEEVFLNGFGSVRGYNYETQQEDPELVQTQGPVTVNWVTKPFVYFSDLGLPVRADGVF